LYAFVDEAVNVFYCFKYSNRTGYECFGKFFIGNNRKSAGAIFDQLKGRKNVDEKSLLQLDLMESVNGLPTNMQMLSCSLEDLAENCKIITKERFRLLNMEEK
jgi:hypothetical protein